MEPLQWESITSSFTAGTIVSGAPACRWKSFFPAYTLSPQGTFATDKNRNPIPPLGLLPPQQHRRKSGCVLQLCTLLSDRGALCGQFWSTAERCCSRYGRRQSPASLAVGQGDTMGNSSGVVVGFQSHAAAGNMPPRWVCMSPGISAVCFTVWCMYTLWH